MTATQLQSMKSVCASVWCVGWISSYVLSPLRLLQVRTATWRKTEQLHWRTRNKHKSITASLQLWHVMWWKLAVWFIVIKDLNFCFSCFFMTTCMCYLLHDTYQVCQVPSSERTCAPLEYDLKIVQNRPWPDVSLKQESERSGDSKQIQTLRLTHFLAVTGSSTGQSVHKNSPLFGSHRFCPRRLKFVCMKVSVCVFVKWGRGNGSGL